MTETNSTPVVDSTSVQLAERAFIALRCAGRALRQANATLEAAALIEKEGEDDKIYVVDLCEGGAELSFQAIVAAAEEASFFSKLAYGEGAEVFHE